MNQIAMVDFNEPWDLGDVIFNVEGRRVYASRSVLSMWSPVMKAMFFDDFKEKSAKEIKLPGKIYEDVLELIRVLHPPNKELDESNVGIILPLAQEYQMWELTGRCECFLLERPPSVLGLVLAEEFNLQTLLKRCMRYITKTRLQHLCQEAEFELMSSDTKVAILLEKSTKYEQILYGIKDILEGRKPEQKRFRRGGALCTFSCSDREVLPDKTMPHNAGTERACKTCLLYMARTMLDKLRDLP